MNLVYRSVGLTSKGKIRPINEDNLCIDDFSFSFSTAETSSEKVFRHSVTSIDQTTLAVCDGIGGCEYGEVASELAAKEAVIAHERLSVVGDYATPEIDMLLLGSMIRSANNIVSGAANSLGERRIGSTIAVVHIRGDKVQYCNVGDSRIYHYRANRLTQLSVDHTQYQAYINLGVNDLSEEEIVKSKNRLTAFIGMNANSESIHNTHIGSINAAYGDIFLLCSDGLTDMLTDEHISDALSGAKDASQAEAVAEQLVQAAIEAGGKDNVTLVLTFVDKTDDADIYATYDPCSLLAFCTE